MTLIHNNMHKVVPTDEMKEDPTTSLTTTMEA